MKGASLASWLLAIVLASPAIAQAVVPITSCGQKVPAGETGVLQNDLICNYRCTGDGSICDLDDSHHCEGRGACEEEILTLKRDAVLELNGHRVFAASWVLCPRGALPGGRCVVRGPGTISGRIGVLGDGPDILVVDATIDAEWLAVKTPGFAEIRRSNLSTGLRAGAGVKLVGTECAEGAIASEGDVDLVRVKFGNGRSSVEAPGTVRGRDVVMAGVVFIHGRDVRLRRARNRPSDLYNWGSDVAGTRSVRLVDSDPSWVTAGRMPDLVRSTCEQSYVAGDTAQSWGVCTND